MYINPVCAISVGHQTFADKPLNSGRQKCCISWTFLYFIKCNQCSCYIRWYWTCHVDINKYTTRKTLNGFEAILYRPLRRHSCHLVYRFKACGLCFTHIHWMKTMRFGLTNGEVRYERNSRNTTTVAYTPTRNITSFNYPVYILNYFMHEYRKNRSCLCEIFNIVHLETWK